MIYEVFEEGIDPNASFRSMKAVEEADVLLVIGSSLAVYPAAGLVYYYKGRNLVIINKDKTPYDSYANLVINDNIVNVIKELEKI